MGNANIDTGLPFFARDWITRGMLVVLLVIVCLVKLVVVSDLSTVIIFGPHDDLLYVLRALHLLDGNGFGPFDSHTLVKLPGYSLWLAALRLLGIPYVIAMNALYLGCGLFLVAALRRCGIGRLWLAIAFALYALNPITFGGEWYRAFREPLATCLLVMLTALVFETLRASQTGARRWHLPAAMAALLAFALLVREEDTLLWGFIGLCVAAMILLEHRRGTLTAKTSVLWIAAFIAIPAVTAYAANQAMRVFVAGYYGLPILHDMTEGEYPRLLGAIRSVESKKDNRLVMATQEALAKIRAEVPIFAPVVDRLPAVAPGTYSCKLQGVCSEWSNGWMPFLIKDAAYMAGLTRSLPDSQDYFRRVRLEIESACAAGRLKCRDKGHGFLPPMELRWTRAYLYEWYWFARMALRPGPGIIEKPPILFNVHPNVGRLFQTVMMTEYFDSLWEASRVGVPEKRMYQSPWAEWRHNIAVGYPALMLVLQLCALVALLVRIQLADRVPLDAFSLGASAFVLYSLMRISALAYAAVYLGQFDYRIFSSTYCLSSLLSVPILVDAIRAMREAKTQRDGYVRP